MNAWFADNNDCHISENVESVWPPEILCWILQLAVGPDGIKALLPFTRINSQWRRAALGDSSLWTTIYLKQTTIPLLDMILAHAGNRLLTVQVDHPDLNRFESSGNSSAESKNSTTVPFRPIRLVIVIMTSAGYHFHHCHRSFGGLPKIRCNRENCHHPPSVLDSEESFVFPAPGQNKNTSTTFPVNLST